MEPKSVIVIDEEIEAMNIEKPKFDPFTFYAQCIGPNLLQSLSTIVLEPIKHWNTGVLSPLGSVLTPAEVENTALAYGDERGKAYISSLERFTKNLKPEDFDIAKHTEILTRGAHKVYVATEAYLENGVDPGIVVAECGQVNISGQIEECKSEVDKYLDFLDLDIAKTSANSCAELTRNLVQEDLQKPADPEFLAENLRDFKLILEDQVSAEEKVQLLDKIKLRLFLLVRYSNDPSFDYGQRAAMMNAAAQQQQLAYAQFASALQGNPGMQRGPIPNQMNPALMRASANFQGLPQNQQQLLIQQQQIQMQQRLQQQQILQQRMQAQGQQMMAGQQIQAPKQMMANQMGLQNQQLLPGRQIPASPFQHLPQQQVRNCANCGNVCPVNAGAPLCYGNDI